MVVKIPPHSLEAEQSVLWSILIDKNGITSIWDILSKEDFYHNGNELIYEVMLDLFENNKPIDLLTVREKLDDKKVLGSVWGNAYLVELTNAVPTSSNIYEYAMIVKNKAVLRRLSRAWNEILNLSFDENANLNELLEKSEQSIFDVTQTFIRNRLVHIREILNARYDEFAEIHQNPELINLHRTKIGYPSIDNKLWWLKGGDMVIVAARPSMWKTAISLNMAQNVAMGGKNVAIFSLEMSKEQLTDRMISAAMWVDSWKLAKWELEDDEFMKIGEAMEKLSQVSIYIDDGLIGSIVDLKSKARRLKLEMWLDMIIIDYIQLMSSWTSMNRVQEIGEISRWIKNLARELNVPIIALSQLSRAVELRTSKEPVLSDLRESWALEQDADIVLMLYREDYYDEFSEKKWVTNIFIRKNRNGPIGSIELMFEKKHQKFYEIEKNMDVSF